MEKIKDKVKIDDKLFLNSYNVDTESHLAMKELSVCENCEKNICLKICPAHVYEIKDHKITISYEGCLECGACRISCPHDNIDWKCPKGGFGVQFRLA